MKRRSRRPGGVPIDRGARVVAIVTHWYGVNMTTGPVAVFPDVTSALRAAHSMIHRRPANPDVCDERLVVECWTVHDRGGYRDQTLRYVLPFEVTWETPEVAS
jgi:hypothetical protein